MAHAIMTCLRTFIVPEPSMIALIMIGAVALIVRQIRRLRRPRSARVPRA